MGPPWFIINLSCQEEADSGSVFKKGGGRKCYMSMDAMILSLKLVSYCSFRLKVLSTYIVFVITYPSIPCNLLYFLMTCFTHRCYADLKTLLFVEQIFLQSRELTDKPIHKISKNCHNQKTHGKLEYLAFQNVLRVQHIHVSNRKN